MSKFKAGDLALNLQDIPNCISAGVVVELMSRLAPGDLFDWRRLNRYAFIMRKKMAAKAVALIAHDRILTDEVLARGLPSYWDRETKEVDA